MLDKRAILQYLQELNALMEQNDVSGELIICGGAVMSLVFGAREATKDIDGLFEPTTEMRKYIEQIAVNHGLENDWLNDAAKGFIDTSRMEFEVVTEMSNLKISRPTDEEMLAMKLASARMETFDYADALYLMARLNVETIEDVIDIMERYLPPNRLTPLSGFFAEEIFFQYESGRKNLNHTEMKNANELDSSSSDNKRESLADKISRAKAASDRTGDKTSGSKVGRVEKDEDLGR